MPNLFGTVADELSGLFSTGVSAATKAGNLTPEVKQQLLERRWSYMNRRVKKPLIRGEGERMDSGGRHLSDEDRRGSARHV
jgi:hypothetical protein